ncbi:DUF6445 family protein [Frateuria defendens]|uniref:DUF6445 family protein n=1 Tax=Frateuria defendens TaxID=2219559 RepID=UPI00066FDA8B|nr:DUF6445 family protein [Frateuria defendens]
MSLFPQHPAMRPLPYRKPTEGRDYWIVDDVLPDPDAVRRRCLAKTEWEYGYPTTGEAWPGMRAIPALADRELAALDALVCRLTGAKKLWVEEAEGGMRLNHNCVQVVGAAEGVMKPHTDSLNLCRYAAVIYLNPAVPAPCGTSFFRQRQPNGGLGGNLVMPPHRNLVDALGTRFVPPGAFAEDVRVPHRYNRLLLYKANLVHSASAYWGLDFADRRMAAVFFWMA